VSELARSGPGTGAMRDTCVRISALRSKRVEGGPVPTQGGAVVVVVAVAVAADGSGTGLGDAV
jgi:hypothetical protein